MRVRGSDEQYAYLDRNAWFRACSALSRFDMFLLDEAQREMNVLRVDLRYTMCNHSYFSSNCLTKSHAD